MKIAVIGGGAAGFFAAISAKEHNPQEAVTLYEASGKVLGKVKVSGGGRCNVTHACFDNSELVKFYPRGEKQLRQAFHQFSTEDTVKWFESRGVKLKTEADGRMFPVTDDSQTIIDCLMSEIDRLGILLKLNSPIKKLVKQEQGFDLVFRDENVANADKVIVATGGAPKAEGLRWLQELGHRIEEPVPSLFTFNMPAEEITTLMGVVAEPVVVRVQGTKLRSEGPLLITHWGMSGPAILRLSAWGARELHSLGYNFTILVSWAGNITEDQLREKIHKVILPNEQGKIGSKNPFGLPNRLWLYLLQKTEINPDTLWSGIGKKNLNKLINVLVNDSYKVSGKTTFKEEFVTCGGISLKDINMQTMESKVCPDLYFAGEVLDIDGITGGFNFQSAWTTGFIAGNSVISTN